MDTGLLITLICVLGGGFIIILSEINKKKKSFTPASRRQLIPDAIAWFIKYYPDLTDAQIIKLIGTTKNTIKSIKFLTCKLIVSK